MNPTTSTAKVQPLNLRAGEWVEVRSAEEILGTLDDQQSLDRLPFMPEMLQYCGRRFQVYKTAHKTCDTIGHYNIRRMTGAVHLAGLRCDGQAHAGCQAGCLLYWKEAWLKRAAVERRAEAETDSDTAADNRPDAETARHWAALLPGTRVPSTDGDTSERFRCQATDLLAFTTEVRRRERWDPRLYVKDLTSGNVRLADFIWYGFMGAVNAFTDRWFGRRSPHLCGHAVKQPPSASLNLQAGAPVRVRSKREIMQTLGPNLRNRGLHFDVEMVPFCDKGPYKVLRRIEKIVDEKTGKLIELRNPCLVLDGVTCGGNMSSSRMFCPRSSYPYWREVWLESLNGRDEHGSPEAQS